MNVRIFFLALGMVASGMNSLLIAGLLPQIARSLDVSEAAVGISVSVLAVTYALTAPFIPIVFSRFSRRAILMVAMVVFLIGVLLSAFAWDISSFYAARAIVGLGAAAYAAQAMAAAIEIAPPGRQGAAAAWVSMGFAVSMALGVPVGTLLGGAFGYRIAFLVTALIGAVALIGLTSVRIARRADRSTLRQQFRPLASPVVLAVLTLTLFYSVSFFIILTYLYPILVSAAGADGTMVAAALAVFGVCNIVSMGIGGRLIDRFGGLSVIVVCLLVMSVATPLLGAPIGAVGAFIAIAAFGLTGSLIGPATNVALGAMHPQNPATVVGANMSAVQLGAAVGGAAGAAILTSHGASWIAFAAGPPAILAAGICGGILLVRRARRSHDAATTGAVA
ncbi:MFS transporter [Salinibacterium sp. ZJ454]|uniref:MFS transporter n=1 Tax=Salinibacterium sp. ZJ454 TaxID=2708339 RepID=UPI001420594D|nr:MFS transporter [Salinibacterium sp. ZJ454]